MICSSRPCIPCPSLALTFSRYHLFNLFSKASLKEDDSGRLYEDFFRVAVQGEVRADWHPFLMTFKKEFVEYRRRTYCDPATAGRLCGTNSTAAKVGDGDTNSNCISDGTHRHIYTHIHTFQDDDADRIFPREIYWRPSIFRSMPLFAIMWIAHLPGGYGSTSR